MTDTSINPCSVNAKGTKVNFGRYEHGQLKIFPAHTTELEYYAISHVWGEIEWLEIPGIQGKKRVSREKAYFIEHELGSLVGDTAFWMDTLTVNQRNESEKIATVQAIPAIFRDAIVTIAIREQDGFYDCCMEAVQDCTGWDDIFSTMNSHNSDVHSDHLRHESYLKRLWTLQECLLSRNIKFVAPQNNIPRAKEESIHSNWLEHDFQWQNIMDSLFILAVTFFDGADDNDRQEDHFIKAYLSSGSISKYENATLIRTQQDDIHTGNFHSANLSSGRAATYPRDYIFATMPQFPRYQYPPDAQQMTFPEIFRDLYEKAAMSGHAFVCRFTYSMMDPAAANNREIAWQPSESLPDPTCLGDFLKLIDGRTPNSSSPTSPEIHLTTVVKVKELTFEPFYIERILETIEATIKFGSRIWSESHVSGELSKYRSVPSHSWTLDSLDALTCRRVHTGTPFEGRIMRLDSETLVATGPGLEYLEVSPALATSAELVETSQDLKPSPKPASSGDFENNDEWEDCSDDDCSGDDDNNAITLFQQSRKILDLMWTTLDEKSVNYPQREAWHYFKKSMRLMWSPPLLRTMALLAAIVACRISSVCRIMGQPALYPSVFDVQGQHSTRPVGTACKNQR